MYLSKALHQRRECSKEDKDNEYLLDSQHTTYYVCSGSSFGGKYNGLRC